MLQRRQPGAGFREMPPGNRRALPHAVIVPFLLLSLVVNPLPARARPASEPHGPASAPARTPDAFAAALRRYPYLTDVVAEYATLNWATDNSQSTGSATWGQVGVESCNANSVPATRTTIVVNGVTAYQWKAQLTLTPGTQYCYRVFLGATDLLGTDASPQFWTQVPAGLSEPFSFAVIGDWGAVDAAGNNPPQANLMTLLAASGARFALTVGDNTYPSGDQAEYGDLYQTGAGLEAVFGPEFWTKAGASIPLFPAIGNHGYNRPETPHSHLVNWPQDQAVALSGGRYIKETYCCLNGTSSGSYPSTWYAFDAGNARFYVLETAWADGNVGTANAYKNDHDYRWTAASAEYQWLEGDLATHPSQLKFAVFHYPLYSDNVNEPSNTYLQGAGSLEGLLNQYGVSIGFSGHSHNYQRFLKPHSGSLITYLTGGGGAPLTPINTCSAFDGYAIGWANTANVGSACHTTPPGSSAQVFHFLLVHVNGSVVTVTPINSLGQQFDAQVYNFLTLTPSLYLPAVIR